MKESSAFFLQDFDQFKSPVTAILLLLMALGISSCSSVLYTTQGQNVPLFQNKGEVALTGAIGGTGRTSGLSAQAAVAVSNDWMIMSSLYSFGVSGNGTMFLTHSGSGSYFELGGGKFKYNSENRICREIVFGVGFGSISNSYNVDFVDLSYIKPFLQPSWGFSTRNFEAAITPRIGLVSYQSKSASPSQRPDLDAFYSSRQNTFVFEPGLTLRTGTRSVKVQFQYNYTTFNYQLGTSNPNTTLSTHKPVDRTFISIGIFVLISHRGVSVR